MRVFERYEEAIRRLEIMDKTRRRQKQENVPTSVEKVYPDESVDPFALYKLLFPGSENWGRQDQKRSSDLRG
jgi:hypothetical protein